MTFSDDAIRAGIRAFQSGHNGHDDLSDWRAFLQAAVAFQAPDPAHLPLAVSSAPGHIWLDLGFDPAVEDAHFSTLHDLTWSADNASGYGIKYIRADLAIPAPEGALREALELIAGTDPVDAALDPQRAIRVARAALAAPAPQDSLDSAQPSKGVAMQAAPVAEVHENGGQKWARLLADLPPRTMLYAAPAPQAPVALTNEQIAKAQNDAQIAFALGKHQTYEHALTRAVEGAHHIPAPQAKEPTNDR